jgi:PIN domain nuclease of toxin-antitoxin system
MRRVLLDAHVLLWWLAGSSQLGRGTRRILADAETEVFVSAATIWEISIKLELGKLKAPKNIEREVEREGFSKLSITLSHAQLAGSLPPVHRDPFDRMLVAQAQLENFELVSADPVFARYSVRLIRATE